MNGSIFRAFFERGEDIGSPAILQKLASELGMDGECLQHSLERNDFGGDVLGDEEMAARIGISGVPAFISGRNYLVGVQSADSLEHLVRTSV